jgi:hypothetical protein
VTNDQLASVTFAVDVGAAVLVDIPRVARRRVGHTSRVSAGSDNTAGLAPRKGFARPAPSRGDLPIPPICQRPAPRERHTRFPAAEIAARSRVVITATSHAIGTAHTSTAVEVARRTEAAVQAEWTRYLGRRATVQLHRTLSRLREITDPYR